MINREELAPIGQFRKPHGTKGEIQIAITNSTFTDVIAGLTRNPLTDDVVIAGLTRNPLTDDVVIAGLTRNPLNNAFLICEIDGIFVPFRIENCRIISDSTAYIQLKNIDSDQKARQLLSHKEVYYPKKYLMEDAEDDSFTWNYFIGFTVTDEQLGKIGNIVDIDETTINTLFIIEKGDEEILIPATEEFIIRIDENQKELIVALPEGLVELG